MHIPQGTKIAVVASIVRAVSNGEFVRDETGGFFYLNNVLQNKYWAKAGGAHFIVFFDSQSELDSAMDRANDMRLFQDSGKVEEPRP